MDSVKRKILITILILILLVIIVFICLINLKESENSNNYYFNDTDDENIIQYEQSEYIEQSPQDMEVDYKTLRRMNSYFMFDLEDKINLLFDFSASNESNRLISVLSKEYIDIIGINNENILDKINLPYSEFIIQEVYSSKIEGNGKYYIYGLGKREGINTTLDNLYFIIDVDYTNSTFEITLSNEEIFNNAKEGIAPEAQYISILPNGYNRIDWFNMTAERLIKKYIRDYKNKALYKPEYAYEILSDENKQEEQFYSLEKYIQYTRVNSEYIENMTLDNYEKTIKDEYIEYDFWCNNTNYIIQEDWLMDYTIYIK